VGNYQRYLPNVAENDPLNRRIQANLDGTQDELPDKFEFWDKERVKEAVAGVMREDQRQKDKIATGQNGDAFIAVHPEYVDSKANSELMRHQLKTQFGECLYTLEHYESAYEALRASNFLALDQKEVAKQNRAEAKARAEAERARSVPPTEQQLYEMPLEDLRRLDAVKRMQEAGERGNW
jgi:hypothetical protein